MAGLAGRRTGPTCPREGEGALTRVLLTLPPFSEEPTPHPGAEQGKGHTSRADWGWGRWGDRGLSPQRGLSDSLLVRKWQQQPPRWR